MRISDLEFRRVLFRSSHRRRTARKSRPCDKTAGNRRLLLSVRDIAPSWACCRLAAYHCWGEARPCSSAKAIAEEPLTRKRLENHETDLSRSRFDPTAIRRRSEEHTSELQSLMRISYAVFCLKKKKTTQNDTIFNITNTHNPTRNINKNRKSPN